MAEKKFSCLPDTSWAGDSAGERQVGDGAADAGAGEGADAIVPADEGAVITRRYLKTMELRANSSNNTIYADANGTIAYFHGNLHSPARCSIRLDGACGRQRCGDGMAGGSTR